MPIRLSMAAVLIVLSAGALIAQEYSGFPENRMRQSRPDNQNVFMPEETYPENRVVIRTTDVITVARGMQISGEIFTDFDADIVPGTAPATVPRGQLQNINVTVELFHYDVVVERDPKTGRAKPPKIDAKDEGRPVDGQSVTVQPKQSFAGFGLANFTLPALTKPLAPGVYKLVARVRFKSQSNDIQQAFKWMSDWYGSRSYFDDVLVETVFEPVTGNAKLHEEVYRDLMDRVGQVKNESTIWIGEVWKNGQLELIPPERGTDRKPANIAIWSHHTDTAEQVMEFEYQLDHVDEVIDNELALKEKVDGATEEMIEKWRREAAEDKIRIRRDNKDLIDKYGGRLNKEELQMLTTTKAARLAVMDQVLTFHEYLIYKYWVLVDGVLTYSGWHKVNVPAYNIWEAVTKSDLEGGALRRTQALQAVRDSEEGLQGRWDQRREQWRFFPPEATQLAFSYLKKKEETDTWDAKKFCEKKGAEVALKIESWEKFREDFIVDFYNESQKMFEAVTTTGVYATQVWPEVLASAKEARDDVIRSTYSWEHLVRTDDKTGDTSEMVQEDWKNSPVQSLEGVNLAQFYKKGTAQPGTLKLRFESSVSKIKSDLAMVNFTSAYRRALEVEKPDLKNLPGKRPPSAPSQE